MATPARMVELNCPKCHRAHWTIDHDYRGAELMGERELSYEERSYDCPLCGVRTTGYKVGQKSPSEFLLQPHDMYPMTERDFGSWLSIFRAQFPDDERLGTVGVDWYPGKSQEHHETQLSLARTIELSQKYRFSLSNCSPDDKRIRVCAQGDGEAHFWIDPTVELDCCYYGFDANDLKTIRDLLVRNEPAIRQAWHRFSNYARSAQAKWLAIIEGNETG